MQFVETPLLFRTRPCVFVAIVVAVVVIVFFQTPVDFRKLGSEYVLSDTAGLISNVLDSTASGVLINNLQS